MEKSCSYGFGKTLSLPYDQTLAKTREALQGQGFGILSEIDVRAKMKEKLGVEFRPYVILGACNPPLAHQALSAEPNLGLLLPCNVIVYQVDKERTRVMAMDPVAALNLVGNPEVEKVARQVRELLDKAMKAL